MRFLCLHGLGTNADVRYLSISYQLFKHPSLNWRLCADFFCKKISDLRDSDRSVL
jgi:hypothetical protein